jgi:hypothetical protein
MALGAVSNNMFYPRISGDRYINPLTDFGFKRLFGTEPNKNLLIDFLNVILRKRKGRKIYCGNAKG